MNDEAKCYVPLGGATRYSRLSTAPDVLPIIIVPGIMGTRLQCSGEGGSMKLAWDPPDGLKQWPGSTVDVATLAWGTDLVPAEVAQTWASKSATKDIRNAAHVVWSFYEGLATAMRDKLAKAIADARKAASPAVPGTVKPTVYCAGYDWRGSNELSAMRHLDAVVDEARKELGDVRVVLLAHSMGGLVSRCYARANPHKVSALFLMGSPTLGAPEAYCYLKQGLDPWGKPGILFRRKWPPGDKWAHSRTFMRAFPSTYQLMPHHLYSDPLDPKWIKFEEDDTAIDRRTWPIPEARSGKFGAFADCHPEYTRPFKDLYAGLMDGKEGEAPSGFDETTIARNIDCYDAIRRHLTDEAPRSVGEAIQDPLALVRGTTVFMPPRTYCIYSNQGETVTKVALGAAQRAQKTDGTEKWVVAWADATTAKTKKSGDQTVPAISGYPKDHATFADVLALKADAAHGTISNDGETVRYILKTIAALCAAATNRLPEPYGVAPASPPATPTPASPGAPCAPPDAAPPDAT